MYAVNGKIGSNRLNYEELVEKNVYIFFFFLFRKITELAWIFFRILFLYSLFLFRCNLCYLNPILVVDEN